MKRRVCDFGLASVLALSLLSMTACEVNTPTTKATAPIAQAPAAHAQPHAQPSPKEAPAAAEKAPSKPVYSPFVLNIKSQNVFKRISFKDVGSKFEQHKTQALYESLAEAMSMELAAQPTLNMSAEVAFDKAITDPKNHLACGSDHLYVDFWRSTHPQRWGYSLWSGCGEDDNFAWKEFKYSVEQAGEPTIEVAPLARSIVSSIKEASDKGCYQKAC